jgi:hypothetical protein
VITTPDLIDALATNVPPVQPLRRPAVRAIGWVFFAVLILGLLGVSEGLRPDLASSVRDPMFDLRVAGALFTGVLAAAAAFMMSLPDRSRLWLLLPLPALALWLSTIGYQCITDWISVEPDGVQFGEAAQCFATLALTSVPLSLAMLIMVRYAALLRPVTVSLMGSLAVAGFAAVALSLFHAIDATLMILMWNLGTAAVFAVLAGTLGRKMFALVAPRPSIGRGN